MSSFADVCTAIVDELAIDFQDYTVERGWSDEPSDKINRAYVWGAGKRRNPDNAHEELIDIGIRLFPNFQQPRGTPRETATFEDAAERLQTALKDKQTTIPQAAGCWFMDVDEITIDQELQMVEARVVVWSSNVFAAI